MKACTVCTQRRGISSLKSQLRGFDRSSGEHEHVRNSIANWPPREGLDRAAILRAQGSTHGCFNIGAVQTSGSTQEFRRRKSPVSASAV
jgi:hypothetical protein